MKLHFRLPPYTSPRIAWRKKILEVIQHFKGFSESDKLELDILLYLPKNKMINDVDNRLKDIMDALQGRVGGSKKFKPVSPIIPNDHQVYRVIIEKRPPKKNDGGRVTIRKFKRMWG